MAEIIEGMSSLLRKMAAIPAKADKAIAPVLESIAQTIRNNAVTSIQAGASGAPYTRYSPKRSGRASAPGQPPHTDTGNLVSHIQVKTTSARSVEVGIIGNRAPYGKWLEYGTSNIAPRPWLRPAYKKAKPIIAAKIKDAGIKLKVEIKQS